MISTDQARTLLTGGTVVGRDGSKIGKVGQIYLDDQTGQPEWVTVSTGLFGSTESFIPLAEADVAGDEIRVPYGKDKVKGAPRVDADGDLSQDQEAELYVFYGLDYTEATSDSGFPTGGQRPDRSGEAGIVGRDTSGPTIDEAMTRSEERLNVGTARQEVGGPGCASSSSPSSRPLRSRSPTRRYGSSGSRSPRRTSATPPPDRR
jgi:sporulation protein YlmC with PRC-barrel domain